MREAIVNLGEDQFLDNMSFNLWNEVECDLETLKQIYDSNESLRQAIRVYFLKHLNEIPHTKLRNSKLRTFLLKIGVPAYVINDALVAVEK